LRYARERLLARNCALVTANPAKLDAFFGTFPRLFDCTGPTAAASRILAIAETMASRPLQSD